MALTASAPLITFLLPALRRLSPALHVCTCTRVYVHVTERVCISPSFPSYLDLNGKDDLRTAPGVILHTQCDPSYSRSVCVPVLMQHR